MSLLNINLDSALSLYALPVLLITALYPQIVKGSLVKKALRDDPNLNTNPRNNIEICKKKGVSEDIIKKMERAQGAHSNGLENWPIYAVTILAANVSGVDQRTTNSLAGGIVVARVIFNWLYINGSNRFLASLRSLTWGAATVMSLTLMVKAANSFNAKVV
ncbi:hypothetical protein FRB96_007830 [Tulasnella sp. 330]|nr:hypothetical protein FRB96_007830 [Tulasnella sp. 330]KAG8885853.1 hypothetical protein FRB98_001566 [Tulasnella sp. 332]